MDISFEKDHTELNFAVWDDAVSRSVLNQLITEHTNKRVDGNYHRELCHDHSAELDDVEALKVLKETAIANRNQMMTGKPLHSHVFALDIINYGRNNK